MGTEASFPSQSGGGWLLLPGSCRQRCAISGGGGQPHLQPLQPLQPLTGVPVGSPSHLPNNAIQGWLLTPDHSYLHAFVSSLLLSKNTILLTTQGAATSRKPSPTTLGCLQTIRTLTSSDIHLDVCILWLYLDHSARPDVPRGYKFTPILHCSTLPNPVQDQATNRSSKMNHDSSVRAAREQPPHPPYNDLHDGHWHVALRSRLRLLLKGACDPDKAKDQHTPAWNLETWTGS